MAKNSLTCFGVGDGWPCADRNHSAFLYRFGQTALLVDAGEPVSRAYHASGLSYDAVDAIFLSHLHADHFAGLFMLLQGMWLEERRKDLTVHLPSLAIRPLRAMLEAAMICEKLLAFRLRFQALRAAKPVAVGGVRVTAFPNAHLGELEKKCDTKPRRKFASYCFLLEGGGVRVGHSSDISRPRDLDPLLAKPLDLLVCELAHFTAEEICAYLRGRDVRRVVFAHLSREYWANLRRTRRCVARLLPDIAHTFARDGDVVGL